MIEVNYAFNSFPALETLVRPAESDWYLSCDSVHIMTPLLLLLMFQLRGVYKLYDDTKFAVFDYQNI